MNTYEDCKSLAEIIKYSDELKTKLKAAKTATEKEDKRAVRKPVIVDENRPKPKRSVTLKRSSDTRKRKEQERLLKKYGIATIRDSRTHLSSKEVAKIRSLIRGGAGAAEAVHVVGCSMSLYYKYKIK